MANAQALPEVRSALRVGQVLLILACGYFLALKVLFAFSAFPIADEAYYWVWGRHPQLSYFDHPPLQAWLQGLSYALFGRSFFALRWMTLAALAGTVWIFYLTAKRVGGADRNAMFGRSMLIYFASPLFGFFCTVAFNDYLLVFLLIASGYLFFCYFTDVEETGRGKLIQLFGAAALLGLAGLTKYNAVYLGLGVAGAVLLRPRLRPLLGQWPIYAAAALSVLMLAPILLWNLQQDFASFRFHFVERRAFGFEGIDVGRMGVFLAETPVLLSPFMLPVILSFFLRRAPTTFERVAKPVAIVTFGLSTLTFLLIANYSYVIWWWNIAAFVLILPFAGRHIGDIVLLLHAGWGLVVNTVLVLSFAIGPVTALWGLGMIGESDTVHGWEQTAQAVREAEAQFNPDFIAANRYQLASQLAFALDNPHVTAISTRPDQFDFWFDAPAHAGENAVVLADEADDVESYKAAFTTLSPIRDITITWQGIEVRRYHLFYGEGFVPR